MQAPDESFILAIIASTFFIVLFGMGSFYVIAHFEKKKRKILLAQQQRESQFQQELLQAQLEMQEHTFKTISREIHDNVGQILSIIKLNLNIITYKHKDDEHLEEIKTMVTNAISELRDLSSGYYADRLVEEGFLVAIQHQLNLLEKTGLYKTSFHSEMETLSIEKNRVIFLHRIVQEILHNVVKHSGADQVTAQIARQNGHIILELSDNGKGFDTHHPDFKAGIGLSSIRQRASMIGADIDIDSKPGTGTKVKLLFSQHE